MPVLCPETGFGETTRAGSPARSRIWITAQSRRWLVLGPGVRYERASGLTLDDSRGRLHLEAVPLAVLRDAGVAAAAGVPTQATSP